MSLKEAAVIKDLYELEIVSPPSFPKGPALVLATALAGPRRRIYETTDRSNLTALGSLLYGYEAGPRPFPCGHNCAYITPGARHLLREVEPQLVCLWCLTTAVHDVLQRDFYPAFIADWEFGCDDHDHGAIARYFVSLLELHHELNGRAGITLLAKLSDADRKTLTTFIWEQLAVLKTDEWLSEDGNLSLLQGANQALRHLNRSKRGYYNDHYELADRLGLAL